MAVRQIDKQTFEQMVQQGQKPMLVDFFATWCGPCRAFAPTLDAVAQAYEGRVDVVKVDVDAEPELARQFRVMSIPTLVLLENGQVREKRVGVQSRADVEAMIG